MVGCALTAQVGDVPPSGCHRLQAEQQVSTGLHTAGVIMTCPRLQEEQQVSKAILPYDSYKALYWNPYRDRVEVTKGQQQL